MEPQAVSQDEREWELADEELDRTADVKLVFCRPA